MVRRHQLENRMKQTFALALLGVSLLGLPCLTGCDSGTTTTKTTETTHSDGSGTVDKTKTTTDSNGNSSSTTVHQNNP